MLFPVQYDTTDEYYRIVERVTENTFLSFISDFYAKHERYFTLLLQNMQSICDDYYIGSKTDIVISPITYEELYNYTKNSIHFTTNHLRYIFIKYLVWVRNQIRDHFANDDEYVRELSNVLSKFATNIDTTKIFDRLQNIHSKLQSPVTVYINRIIASLIFQLSKD